jgi:hypothetical protein
MLICFATNVLNTFFNLYHQNKIISLLVLLNVVGELSIFDYFYVKKGIEFCKKHMSLKKYFHPV